MRASGGTIYGNANERSRALIRRAAFIVCLAAAGLTAAFTALNIALGYFQWDFFTLLLLIILSLPAGFLIRAGRVTAGAVLLIAGVEVVIGVEPYFLLGQPLPLAMYLATNCLGFALNVLLAALFVHRHFLIALMVVSSADILVAAVLSANRTVQDSAPYIVIAFLAVGSMAYVFNSLFRSTLASAREEARKAAALREQLLHAQKMEAIGRFAGGIAHDFNNILAAIMGQTEVVLMDDSLPLPVRGPVTEVRKYAGKAAGLVRQLLVFSRKGEATEKFDARPVLEGLEKMLLRVLGRGVSLSISTGPAPAMIRADSGQFEQVVMNLVVNARDAMPEGGTIEVSLGMAEVDHAPPRADPPLKPGHYVTLAVRDTGTGMEPQVMAHLFEPFFTTKPEGMGTGLGLSTIYGIVSQSGGGISVASAPAQGSTFVVYFPRA